MQTSVQAITIHGVLENKVAKCEAVLSEAQSFQEYSTLEQESLMGSPFDIKLNSTFYKINWPESMLPENICAVELGKLNPAIKFTIYILHNDRTHRFMVVGLEKQFEDSWEENRSESHK